MANKNNPNQIDLFDDWFIADQPSNENEPILIISTDSIDEARHLLALRLAQHLTHGNEITSKLLTEESSRAFGGTQASGTYSSKDSYDALEAAVNLHLLGTEDAGWIRINAVEAREKALILTKRIQQLPTQTRRDDEMDEFQQFSTPPALAFVANWVASIHTADVMAEPSAGTGDLAVWPMIAGADIVLNELSPRRHALLTAVFPKARLFRENAEQLDNVLPTDIRPSVVVMNPPFSSTAGRVQGQRDTSNGARHLEQALRRLEEGGRLVAIVGNGMAVDRPAFRDWWRDIEKKYNVRANVGISGREYAKYGTTFDNQILVIDKTGATINPVLTGRVESVADLPALLEGIRNDRKRTQSTLTQSTSHADSESVQDNVQSGGRTRGIGISEDGARAESSGNRSDNGTAATDSETHDQTSAGHVSDDGIRTGDGIPDAVIGGPAGSGGADIGGNSGFSTSDKPRSITVRSKAEEDRLFDVLLTTLVFDNKAAKAFSQITSVIIGTANQTNQALKQWRKEQRKLKPEQRINVLDFIPDDLQRVHRVGQYAENITGQHPSNPSKSDSSSSVVIETISDKKAEFTDSIFANYTPQRLTISGARQHPGKLVQSAAMSAVEPPAPSYSPVLPAYVITDGLLSIAQLESVVYAGQAHSETLPNGSRRGFFIGDGTGVGKGREISGIILDNRMQGRKKAVWVSFNGGLIEDARRDFAGVGGDPSLIFFQGKAKASAEITQKEGILFTTYSTLRAGEKKQETDLGQKAGKTRAQQIIDWLGDDFDGPIAFDESHSMGNAIAVRGKRGVRKPSQQAIAGINLQKSLPNARVTYVSATGATEISNLSYADRLGLWGEGTPFADTHSFIGDVAKGGIAAMELISRDMKSMGMYLARSLSYDGVSYERLEHTLSDLQEDIYNELSGAWQVVLNNVEEALEITQAGKNGNGKSAAMSQFWGAHQRFFNQIITSMQTPSVIDDIRQQLDAGNVAVIQLVNTNEAAQERIIADATANNEALEDLDFTPRQMLMDYVRNGFPVAAYEESTDENGNKVYLPVKDSEGNPVFDREAIALRNALLENLQNIRVPENPLDSIINVFGSERVAEITGRGRRFVQVRGDDGEYRIREEKRNSNSSRRDAEAFQAGKKDILVFSGAGGTGYSFHADNTAENKRKRVHYILQPGWRADSAVQGFGRTHRTNQAQEPHYVLPTTNLKAQKRFISSIARRLDQLGALTRGQRDATSQGMFTASDNLESEYATIALNNFFGDLYRGKTSLGFLQVTKQMGLDLVDENGTLSETKVPAIPQFLNRLLSLKTDMQNAVFDEFEQRLIEAVEYAKQRDLFDVGLQTLTAKSIVKTRDEIAYQDERSGAKTRYIELDVTNDIEYLDWSDTARFKRDHPKDGDLSGWFVAEFGKNKGEVFYMTDIGERLDPEGKTVHRGVVHSIRANSHRYIDHADQISRGWDYRTIAGQYQKVTLTKAITAAEAETLWKEQIANAPTTETKTERMIVGVILPIWDRVEGSEKIYRLQTNDGEQLLGRMLGPKSAKQTLKNLGLDSGVTHKSASELFEVIQKGQRAILSNGWEISITKVNFENRIEIKGKSSFTDAEKRLLKEQGAFSERINWADRLFIPNGESGVQVLERITASKPVVDLLDRKRINDEVDDDELNHGVADLPQSVAAERSFSASLPDTDKPKQNEKVDETRQEVTVMTDSTKKRPYHEIVAKNLIKQLKEGTAPWQRPWDASEAGSFLPYNPISGNRYKGINTLHLMAQDRVDQRWLTYKQALTLDAQVRKGEKGTGIQYWKFTEEQTQKDEYGKAVFDEEGKAVKVTVRLERPRVFFATVFNGEQIDGLPPIQKKEQTWNPIERAENILTASGAKIQHNGGERAFYRPSTDSIHLPDRGLFSSADNYYATSLHELGHWTGHDSRLERDLLHPFGSVGYAKEELRAEIFSMIIGDELGIGHDPSQHAAYVGSWVKALEDDPMEIFRAAADAEKIQGFILGLEQQYIQEQEKEQTQQSVDARLPHEMTLSDFAQQAVVEALPDGHGRKWNVVLDVRYSAFSDADTPDAAIVDVHRNAVNNALYLNTLGATTGDRPTPPLSEVLAEYPDLVSQYPDTDIPQSESNVAQDNEESVMTEYQQELSRLLKLSTLTPGSYIPSEAVKNSHHAAVFVGDRPVILTGSGDDPASVTQAEVLASSDPVQAAFIAAGYNDPIYSGSVSGTHIQWSQHEAVVMSKTAKQMETEGDDGPLVAIVLNDPQSAITTSLCVNTEIARIFDADVPELDDGHKLSALARSETFSLESKTDKRRVNVEGWSQDENASMEPVEQTGKDFVLASDQFTFWTGDGWKWHDAAKRYDDPAMAFKEALSLEYRERDYLEDSHVMLYEHDHNSKTFNLTVTTGLMSNKPALRDRWMKHFGKECPEEILAAKIERSHTEDVTQDNVVKTSNSKTYINVPYKEKDEAKNLGARWDRQERSWFIPPGVDLSPFVNWTTQQNDSTDKQATKKVQVSQSQNEKRVYLAVPYGERKAAKVAGALWDKVAKSWYVGPSADREKLERWQPDNVPAQQGPAMTPREEFVEAMQSLGFIVSGDHPIMDGKKHRITVEGDKTGEQAGFYVGHLDGHPAGYIKNNRTGIDMKWKAKGYSLDPQEKAKLQAEAAEKLAARAAEQERLHEATAQRVSRQTVSLVPVSEPTPYLRDKELQPHVGILTDAEGQKTYIPATDVNGKQWTIQYIQEDGTKRFAKDSRKEGCFHIVGGIDALVQAPALVISEGYATAATNAETLGFATVAAFDSGNLPAVARALHEKFPDKPVIIAGDDDRNRILTDGINPGRSKAEEAAKAVHGTAIFPIFAPGENVYPPSLEPVSPKQYREHERAKRRLEDAQNDPGTVKLTDQEITRLNNSLLSSEQIEALDKMKAHTDFNDLATRSQFGRKGLERQVKAAVSQALQTQEQCQERKLEPQELERTKEKNRVQEHRPKRVARVG